VYYSVHKVKKISLSIEFKPYKRHGRQEDILGKQKPQMKMTKAPETSAIQIGPERLGLFGNVGK
jgi:hypothetical protein